MESKLYKNWKTKFYPVTAKPSDFEDDIFKATEKGKLSSVQYLVEQCKVDPDTNNEDGWAPINIASREGHLYIVQYLVEACKVR